ncbi:MAG: P-loop NTPase fold protein [Arcobacter sp.]|uniref:P-loop NTPase fold protein n=1 Tax=Arcobacter sp. TaxID=1872629 RepID=UPI003C70BE20
MPNKHINEFLDYYTKLPNPQYAVLLKGKWGSGKTHFINEYKKQLYKNQQKYIYVSLYGVTSYDEIETKFLETIHPKLYNKKTIFAGRIAKQVLKGTLKIDLDDDGKIDGNASLQIPNFKPEDLLNTKDYILIFDDLERSGIKIIDLLGYINFFVEHQSYKVILIANEEELEKRKKYRKIKEKLVGKTFEFKTNSSDAFDSFLSELKNERRLKENILEKEKSNILELFKNSKANNLRFLRQSLLDFERFYDEVLISPNKKKEIIKDILYWFFLFSFEIKRGNKEVLDLLYTEREPNLSLLFIFKEKKELTSLDKYKLDDNSDVIIPIVHWKEILINSNIQKDEIEKALENSKYYIDENTPSWKKLSYFDNLTDEEFIILLEDVFKRFQSNEYKDYKHFKFISSLLLFFQEKELLDIEFEKLFDLIKINFKILFDEKSLNMEDIYYIKNRVITDISYENIAYFESENFEKLKSYINEVLEEKKILKQKEDSEKIILAIKEKDTQILLDLLEGKNDVRFIDYKNIPILNYINIDDLFNALIKTDGLTMHYFGGILKDRYYQGKEILFEEEIFLKKLIKRLEDYVSKNRGKVSSYNLKEQIVKNLEIALSNIEEIKNANN